MAFHVLFKTCEVFLTCSLLLKHKSLKHNFFMYENDKNELFKVQDNDCITVVNKITSL